MSIPRILLAVSALVASQWVAGTHSLGGEILYNHVQGYTYRIEVVYITCLESPADRPEIILEYGDGQQDTVPRVGIWDTPMGSCCGIRRSEYVAIHTYAGPGEYTIRFEDQTRGSGILNMPNSVAQGFCVSSLLIIDDDLGPNNSVRFASAPTQLEQEWSTWIHYLQATDLDGDELTFEVITPSGMDCLDISGYLPPFTAPSGWAWLDPSTGDFHWHMPALVGLYVIAIRASEWRDGTLIGSVTRDMVLCITMPATGFAEISGNDALAIRPTLTHGITFVTNPGLSPMAITILDARSSHVTNTLLPPGEHPIDLGHLAPGLYTVRGNHADGSILTGRVVRE